MKYDLDISVDEKLERLQSATNELLECQVLYDVYNENGLAPFHVYDFEQWKKEQKR